MEIPAFAGMGLENTKHGLKSVRQCWKIVGLRNLALLLQLAVILIPSFSNVKLIVANFFVNLELSLLNED